MDCNVCYPRRHESALDRAAACSPSIQKHERSRARLRRILSTSSGLQGEVFELLSRKQACWSRRNVWRRGHTEALLESGADVLALDQDPDAVRHVTERWRILAAHHVRQANFRHADCVLDELGIRTIGGALLIWVFLTATRKRGARVQFHAKRSAGHADDRGRASPPRQSSTIIGRRLDHLFRELGEEPAARRIAA